jgi:hypothetical protein
LTSCKTKVVAVNNYCVIAQPIRATCDDKKALKASSASKPFIEKIVNHNQIFYQTCKIKKVQEVCK